MRLNKSTNDAIRILIDCARADGTLVKVADISRRLEITIQNVFKIVHMLSRARLVAAVRGRNGGVRLAHPPGAIRIGDIVRAMEATELDLDSSGAQRVGANDVNRVLDSALEAFVGVLDQHTLEDMMKTSSKARRPGASSAKKPASGRRMPLLSTSARTSRSQPRAK